MKVKWFKKGLAIVLAFSMIIGAVPFMGAKEVQAAEGDSVTIDSITYEVTSEEEDNKTACVESASESISGSITIPETVSINNVDYKVTSIGEYVFMGCRSLTSIDIPTSVTSIGNCAFYRCSELTSITLSGSITSIGNKAFYGCSKFTSIIIPKEVTSITLPCVLEEYLSDITGIITYLHDIKYKEWREPTCRDVGLVEHWTCLVCGRNYSDEALTTEISNTTIPATNHEYTEVRNAVAATTTSTGYTGDTYCTYCGMKVSSGQVIAKIEVTPSSETPSPETTPQVNVSYRTHVQSIGWQSVVTNGAVSGTIGQSKRLEGININVVNKPVTGGIRYTTHVQGIGWQDWAKNGESAGTTGLSKRLEGIEIVLVAKGGSAPGSTTRPFVQK